MVHVLPLSALISLAVTVAVSTVSSVGGVPVSPGGSAEVAAATCSDPVLAARNGLCTCPINCRCYTWTKLRRVDCVRRRLVNVNANDIPVQVQVLDFSDNLIAELTDGYFWGLSHVQWLSVARNALHNVEPLSLSGLRRLTVLDLSDNRLRVLPPRLFFETPRLKELRLAGNRLVAAHHHHTPLPLVEARQLQELDVSRCQLAYLSPSAFVGVPRVISLNVSNNQFLQMPVSAFRTLTFLRHLYADGNPFNCDPEMEKLTSALSHSNVTASGLCEVRSTSPVALARMVAAPPNQYIQFGDQGWERDRDRNRDWDRGRDTDRNKDQDYLFDEWGMEEVYTPPRLIPPQPTASQNEPNSDHCGAITKPNPFFKFDYSSLFSFVVGFKVGFVTALLVIRGCSARNRSTEVTDADVANARLLQHNGSRPDASEPTDAGRQCTSENERPETPPPPYHELRFSNGSTHNNSNS